METSIVETAAARLHALANDNPHLAEAIEYYRCLVPAIIASGDHIPPIHLPAGVIEKKLSSGTSLLVGEDWSIDPGICRAIFLSISQAVRRSVGSSGVETLGEYAPGWSSARALLLDRIIANVENGNLYPLALLSAIGSDGNSFIKETSTRLDLDAHLLELVTINTLKAFLHAWRKVLQPYAALGKWQRGLCPFCGNAASLAEIQGVERSRYLRCLQCGARWPYPNLQCAFCGNNDNHTLGILELESEAHKYYAHTCDSCQHYIKTVTTFDPLPAELLPAEDLATLHLDTFAMEKGYK